MKTAHLLVRYRYEFFRVAQINNNGTIEVQRLYYFRKDLPKSLDIEARDVTSWKIIIIKKE